MVEYILDNCFIEGEGANKTTFRNYISLPFYRLPTGLIAQGRQNITVIKQLTIMSINDWQGPTPYINGAVIFGVVSTFILSTSGLLWALPFTIIGTILGITVSSCNNYSAWMMLCNFLKLIAKFWWRQSDCRESCLYLLCLHCIWLDSCLRWICHFLKCNTTYYYTSIISWLKR